MPSITYREGISQALWEEMERDERIFIMGEEVGVWGGTYAVTRGFYDHFGEKRVRDMPIAEGVIAGCAAGAAMAGLRPVAGRRGSPPLLLGDVRRSALVAPEEVSKAPLQLQVLVDGQLLLGLVRQFVLAVHDLIERPHAGIHAEPRDGDGVLGIVPPAAGTGG